VIGESVKDQCQPSFQTNQAVCPRPFSIERSKSGPLQMRMTALKP